MAIDLSSKVGQLRLECGDVLDLPFMSDAEYTYILSKHGDVVKDSVVDALYAILARLSLQTRERLDRLEFFGNQRFEQYVQFLKDKIAELTGQGNGRIAENIAVYAGGISAADAAAYAADTDLIQYQPPFTDTSSDTTWGW